MACHSLFVPALHVLSLHAEYQPRIYPAVRLFWSANRPSRCPGFNVAHTAYCCPRRRYGVSTNLDFTVAMSPVRSTGIRGVKHHAVQPAQQGDCGRRERSPAVRLLHMDHSTPASPSISDGQPTPPTPSPKQMSAGPPAPTMPIVERAAGLEHGADRITEQEVKGHQRGRTAVPPKKKARCEKPTIEIEAQLVDEEGRVTVVRTTDPITTTRGDEENKEDKRATFLSVESKKQAIPVCHTAPHSRSSGSRNGSRKSSSSGSSGRFNDTHPSGYTPTPFYFTLVKALTGKRKRWLSCE